MKRLVRRPLGPEERPSVGPAARVRRPAGLLARLALAPLCGAALVACSAGTPGSAAPTPTGSPTATAASSPTAGTPTTAAPTPAASPTGSAGPQARVIDVTYAGGELTGVEPRVEVGLGEQVVLRVTSDVPEEIHVHGYDRYLDVPAGGTAEVSFVADIPGAFEVELHEAGRPVFQLRVA